VLQLLQGLMPGQLHWRACARGLHAAADFAATLLLLLLVV
jgi:hypothetical protein